MVWAGTSAVRLAVDRHHRLAWLLRARTSEAAVPTLPGREARRAGDRCGERLRPAAPLQLERGSGTRFPSLREYSMRYGLNLDRLERTRPDALIMHPGPINRGVEISPEVADGPRSIILEQVENGVAVRMALLYLFCGGADETAH